MIPPYILDKTELVIPSLDNIRVIFSDKFQRDVTLERVIKVRLEIYSRT